MEPVSEQQDRVLTQSTNALTFIHLQLVELTRDSGNMLQNGPASLQNLLELQNKLEKILHETRVACRPPLRKPVMSDFETVGQIGQGGFATVDLVAHKVTGQKFAMKKIKRKKVTKDVRDQVLLERDILTFANNPFVVSMFCYFETETHLCMVLEHAGGGDCAKILEMHGRLPVDLARIYSAETVLALEYIHSYGILHRDLKPNNLLISSIGHIKLADFGLSKIGPVNMSTNLDQNYINTASQEFGDEDMRCTPLYVAPEMILQLGYGEPMDWWSLGIVLYEFLVGTVPFLAEDVEEIFEKVLEDKVPWPTGKDILPVDAHSLIRRLLDKNHMTRLGTGGAVKVKKHPFFQDVPWNNLLDLNVPIMKSKRSTSYCEKVSSNGGSSDGESSEEDGSPCQVSDFGYVAFRFKEVYGSPGYLSLSNLSLSEHHQVPETISEDRHDEAVEKPTSVRMDPVSEQPKTDCVSNVRNIIHLKLEKMKRLVTGSRIMKKREIIHRLKKDS